MKRPSRRPMIIPTDEYAKKFVEARGKVKLTGAQKMDRDYLLKLFEEFKKLKKGKIAKNRPPKRERLRYTPVQMYDNAMKYIETTIDAGQPLTVTSLSLFMGFNRATLFNSMKTEALPKSHYQFIYDCVGFIEAYNEYAVHRKQNPAGPIFILKNFGWADKLEITADATKGALTEKERQEAQKRLSEFSE